MKCKQIFLTETQLEELYKEMKEDGISLSELVRRIVHEYLKNKKRDLI